MKVKFVPQNVVCEVKSGQTVLDVALENNIYIKSICRGVPSCAECRVILAEGEYNVLQPSSAELALIGSGYFLDRRRLSCQLKCFGDITVDLSEQVEKENELKNPKPRSRNSREESIQSSAVMGNVMPQPAAPQPAAPRPTPRPQAQQPSKPQVEQQQQQPRNQNNKPPDKK